MRGIKYALSFLLGCLYSSCWWAVNSPEINQYDKITPGLILFIGGLLIVAATVKWFLDHWDDEDILK